jgi:hypothetical protein
MDSQGPLSRTSSALLGSPIRAVCWAAVGGVGDGVDVFGGPSRQVGALGKYWRRRLDAHPGWGHLREHLGIAFPRDQGRHSRPSGDTKDRAAQQRCQDEASSAAAHRVRAEGPPLRRGPCVVRGNLVSQAGRGTLCPGTGRSLDCSALRECQRPSPARSSRTAAPTNETMAAMPAMVPIVAKA